MMLNFSGLNPELKIRHIAKVHFGDLATSLENQSNVTSAAKADIQKD